jgi:hypothetical protein
MSNNGKEFSHPNKMKTTISVGLLAVALLATGAIATQVNAYHDSNCQEYAYNVFSEQWSCQDINGIEGVYFVNSNAECNVYDDTSCQIFQKSFTGKENQCINNNGGNMVPLHVLLKYATSNRNWIFADSPRDKQFRSSCEKSPNQTCGRFGGAEYRAAIVKFQPLINEFALGHSFTHCLI